MNSKYNENWEPLQWQHEVLKKTFQNHKWTIIWEYPDLALIKIISVLCEKLNYIFYSIIILKCNVHNWQIFRHKDRKIYTFFRYRNKLYVYIFLIKYTLMIINI